MYITEQELDKLRKIKEAFEIVDNVDQVNFNAIHTTLSQIIFDIEERD